MMPSGTPAKVCMIVHKDYNVDGRVKQYAKALLAKGIAVDVICARGTTTSANLNTAHENLKIIYIPVTHKQAGLLRLFFEYLIGLPLYTLFLLYMHLRNHYKIIHIHNMPDLLVFCAILPKIMRAKIIHDIHDPMPEFFQSKTKRSADHPLVKLILFQEKLATTFADQIIASTPLVKRNLVCRNIPAEKITVILNQPDPIIFHRKSTSLENISHKPYFTLIFHGTIAPRYGLELAIRALPILKKEIPNIRLLIIGSESSYCNNLRKLAEDLNVTDQLEIAPPVPIEEIPSFLEQADIGIYTAMPDSHMEIAIPGKIIEYAMMGIPIIASRFNILEQYFPENAILFFEPGNLSQFCKHVLNLYHHPELRQQLIENTDNSYLRQHSLAIENKHYYFLLEKLGLSIS